MAPFKHFQVRPVRSCMLLHYPQIKYRNQPSCGHGAYTAGRIYSVPANGYDFASFFASEM